MMIGVDDLTYRGDPLDDTDCAHLQVHSHICMHISS